MEISKTHINPCSNAVNFSGRKVSEENQAKTYETKENKSFNTMLGVTALAASVVAGLALRGRHNALKALKEATSKAEEFSNLKLKNLDIDLFKKLGKFEKGKALLGDKPFTGSIYTKNGYEISYKDGVLQSSQSITRVYGEPDKFKTYDSGKLYYSRNNDYKYVGEIKNTRYIRSNDGTIVRIQQRGGYYDKVLPESNDIITTIKPDGTITKLEQNLEKYRSGLEHKITYDKTTNLNTGEVKLTKKEIKPYEFTTRPKDTIRKTKTVDGQKVFERVGKDGKVTSWTNNFDKETGIATQTIKEPDGSIVTKMRDKNGNVLTDYGNRYRYHSTTNPEMSEYSTINPYGVLGTSKENMQKFIQEQGLPFVI
jgi:hypothetical protein